MSMTLERSSEVARTEGPGLAGLVGPIRSFVKGGAWLPFLAIFGAGLVSILWLDGRLFFFWDTVVPFRTSQDLYYSSFTWGQLYGEGAWQYPFEFGAYFVAFDALTGGLGLSIELAQQVVVYGLLTLSGVSFYLLLQYLFGPFLGPFTRSAALLSTFTYMFNFYVVFYLFTDLFPSWWLYALLPAIGLLSIDGFRRAQSGRIFKWNVLGITLLLIPASAGFWEPPYLAYTLLLVLVLVWAFRTRVLTPESRILASSR